MTKYCARGFVGTSAFAAVLGMALPVFAQTTDSGVPATQPTSPGIDSPSPGQPDRDRTTGETGSSNTDPNRSGTDRSLDNNQNPGNPQNTPGADTDRNRRSSDSREGSRDSRGNPSRPGAMRDQRLGQTDRGQIRGGPIGSREWVRVGYDFDDDGRFDSFDYVRQDDLQRIRSASADANRGDSGMRGNDSGLRRNDQASRGNEPGFRGNDSGMRGDPGMRSDSGMRGNPGGMANRGEASNDRRDRDFNLDRDEPMNRGQREDFNRNRDDSNRNMNMQDRDRSGSRARGMQGGDAMVSGRSQRIEGRVLNVDRLDIHNRRHLVALIDSGDNGRVQVDFGPVENDSDRLDFVREGERVSLFGRHSSAHDRTVLIAERVERNGQFITLDTGWINQGSRNNLGGTQFSGEVLSTRMASFIGHDHRHLLATVRLEDGCTTIVDLGPAQDLDNLTLGRGDSISVVAREGCINGNGGLIADELRTSDGQLVRLDNYEVDTAARLRGRPTSSGMEGDEDDFNSDSSWRSRSGDTQGSWNSGSTGVRSGSDLNRSRNGTLEGAPIGPSSTGNSTSGTDTPMDRNAADRSKQPIPDDSTAPVPPTPSQEQDDDMDRSHDDDDDHDDDDANKSNSNSGSSTGSGSNTGNNTSGNGNTSGTGSGTNR